VLWHTQSEVEEVSGVRQRKIESGDVDMTERERAVSNRIKRSERLAAAAALRHQ
jgi:hypothetical protein